MAVQNVLKDVLPPIKRGELYIVLGIWSFSEPKINGIS